MRGRIERVLLVAALALPVPVLAASGLAVPLPTIVERVAAALVPFVEGPPLTADVILARAARPGSIVTAPGEQPYVAGDPDSVVAGATSDAVGEGTQAAAARAARGVDSLPGSESASSGPQEGSDLPTASEPGTPQVSDEPSGGSGERGEGPTNDHSGSSSDGGSESPKPTPTPSPSPQPTPAPKPKPTPTPTPDAEPADTPNTGATDTAVEPSREPTTAPATPSEPDKNEPKGGQPTDVGPPVEVADPAKDDVPDGGAPGQESGARGRPAQSDPGTGPPPR